MEFSSIVTKTSNGGRPSVSYYLTNDTFKMFCMMAGTAQGRQIRKYYLECERQLKEVAVQPLSGLERFDTLIARAKELAALDPSNIRASLERLLLVEIEPIPHTPDKAPQNVSESQLLLNYVAEKGDVSPRDTQRGCCLKRLGVTRAGDYRARLNGLVDAGKLVESKGLYSIPR